MNGFRLIIFILMICFSISGSYAQNAVKLLDTKSNSEMAVPDFNGNNLQVIIFTSDHCPYAKLYEDRILALYEKFNSKGVGFILVNPNDSKIWKADSEKQMALRAVNYPFPYLSDKSRILADLLGAEKTPTAYVLSPSKENGYSILYKGAIDDNPHVATDVNSQLLEDAIENILNGRATKSNEPLGCRIKS